MPSNASHYAVAHDLLFIQQGSFDDARALIEDHEPHARYYRQALNHLERIARAHKFNETCAFDDGGSYCYGHKTYIIR